MPLLRFVTHLPHSGLGKNWSSVEETLLEAIARRKESVSPAFGHLPQNWVHEYMNCLLLQNSCRRLQELFRDFDRLRRGAHGLGARAGFPRCFHSYGHCPHGDAHPSPMQDCATVPDAIGARAPEPLDTGGGIAVDG